MTLSAASSALRLDRYSPMPQLKRVGLGCGTGVLIAHRAYYVDANLMGIVIALVDPDSWRREDWRSAAFFGAFDGVCFIVAIWLTRVFWQ